MTTITTQQRVGLTAAAVVVVAGILWFIFGHARHDGPLVLYGNVDIRAVTLGFRVAGRVDRVAVDEGDIVKEGQELARLDPVPLQLASDEAAASAAGAAAHAQLLKSGFRTEDVAQGLASVAERRAAVTYAEQQLVRQEELRGTGAVAQRIYDDAVSVRDQARARLSVAEAALSELQHGYRPQDVSEAESTAARAAAVAAQAHQRLTDGILRAPSDGVVTTRAVESGAIIAAGAPAITLTLSSPVWVRVYVAEPDLGRVAPGREVLVYTDSRPDRPYHGQVGFVSPTAEFTPKNVETPDLRTALVYRARVVIRDADGALRQGMPVTARLDNASIADRRP